MVAHCHFLKPLALIRDAHIFEHLLEFLLVFCDVFQIGGLCDINLVHTLDRQLISAQNKDLVVSLLNFEEGEFMEILDCFEAVVNLGFGFL